MFKYSGFIVALIFSQTLAQTSTSNAAAQSATATTVVNPAPAQATPVVKPSKDASEKSEKDKQ